MKRTEGRRSARTPGGSRGAGRAAGNMDGSTEASTFILKTYKMVYNCHTADPDPGSVCCWSQDGDSFIIKKVDEFTELLPHFFKHRNFRSFVRQLNFYGFRKVRAESALITARPAEWSEFKHDYFQQDRPELLVHIKRTGTSDHSHSKLSGSAVDSASNGGPAHPDQPSVSAVEFDQMRRQILVVQQQVNALTAMVTQLFAERSVELHHQQSMQQAVADGEAARNLKRQRSRSKPAVPSSASSQPRSSSSLPTSRFEGMPLTAARQPTSVELLRELLSSRGMDGGSFEFAGAPFSLSSMAEDDVRLDVDTSSQQHIPPSFDASTESAASAIASLSHASRLPEASDKDGEVGSPPGVENTQAQHQHGEQWGQLEGAPLKRSRTSAFKET